MSYQHIFKKSVNFYRHDGYNNSRTVGVSNQSKLWLLLLSALLCNPVKAATSGAAPAPTAQTNLPPYSKLIKSGQHKFHLRKMAPGSTTAAGNLPVIVLLAGPNQNFHADSAWFALLQPVLAQKYQVLAIDRLGNGFSDNAENVSYQRFSQDLTALLPTLTSKPVILVSFASASISASLFHQQQQAKSASQVQAMVWIDPDIPTPEALALYQGYPVDWYQKHLQQLLPELAKGVWNQRTLDKLAAERTEVAALLSNAHQANMDWGYFDAISKQRQTPQRQQQRAIEIANYGKDLDLYAALPVISDIPVTVIDSDFESMDIAALQQVAAKSEVNQSDAEKRDAEQAKTQIKALQQWQQQGSVWSEQLASNSGGQYIPLKDSHHLVMFQHPEKIVAAIDWLSEKVTAKADVREAPLNVTAD